MSLTSLQAAALLTELTTDPTHLGYAALLAVGNDAAVVDLGNAVNYSGGAPVYSVIRPVPWGDVVQWGATVGLRSKIEIAAADATNTARDYALLLLDYIGSLGLKSETSEGVLDVTDPLVAGKIASGATYTPGAGAIATPGMLDALVGAEAGSPLAAAPIMTSVQKDALIGLGTVAISRFAQVLGYGVVVSHGDVSAAMLASRPNHLVGA